MADLWWGEVDGVWHHYGTRGEGRASCGSPKVPIILRGGMPQGATPCEACLPENRPEAPKYSASELTAAKDRVGRLLTRAKAQNLYGNDKLTEANQILKDAADLHEAARALCEKYDLGDPPPEMEFFHINPTAS